MAFKDDIPRPHEALVMGFVIEGEAEEDAERLARTALGSLVAAGYVLHMRGSDKPAEMTAEIGEEE